MRFSSLVLLLVERWHVTHLSGIGLGTSLISFSIPHWFLTSSCTLMRWASLLSEAHHFFYISCGFLINAVCHFNHHIICVMYSNFHFSESFPLGFASIAAPILSVAQYFKDTLPTSILSLIKKYLILLCFILFELDPFSLFSNFIELMLSWYNSFFSTSHNCPSWNRVSITPTAMHHQLLLSQPPLSFLCSVSVSMKKLVTAPCPKIISPPMCPYNLYAQQRMHLHTMLLDQSGHPWGQVLKFLCPSDISILAISDLEQIVGCFSWCSSLNHLQELINDFVMYSFIDNLSFFLGFLCDA